MQRLFGALLRQQNALAAGVRGLRGSALLNAKEAVRELTPAQSAYMEQWKKHAPSTMADPKFAGEYLERKQEAAPGAPIPAKLTLSFYLPHEIEFEAKQVDSVTIPATSGDFGVLPGHVPTVAQMRPGVITVQSEDKDAKKYFVSGGFAFVHADSTTEICAIEAVPVENLDAESVKQGVASYSAKVAGAKDDTERAEAQIGLDVCSAMAAAIDAK